MFDIHCHLEYTDNPEEILKECRKKGMTGLTSSIANPKDVERMLVLKRGNEGFLNFSVGFHPHHETDYSDSDIDKYIQEIHNARYNYVAIGEVGLDYDGAFNPERQQKIFIKFVEEALEMHLPLVVHCRKAFPDLLKILEDRNASHVAFHCFSGSESDLKKILSHPEWFISFATNVCYTQKHPRLASLVPMNRMLLETDSPWLDPDIPQGQERGLTNRPWKIVKSAEVIGKIKGMKPDEILKITTENAKRLFRL